MAISSIAVTRKRYLLFRTERNLSFPRNRTEPNPGSHRTQTEPNLNNEGSFRSLIDTRSSDSERQRSGAVSTPALLVANLSTQSLLTAFPYSSRSHTQTRRCCRPWSTCHIFLCNELSDTSKCCQHYSQRVFGIEPYS